MILTAGTKIVFLIGFYAGCTGNIINHSDNYTRYTVTNVECKGVKIPEVFSAGANEIRKVEGNIK